MSDVLTGLYQSPSDAAETMRMLEYNEVSLSDITVVANDALDRDSLAFTQNSKVAEGVAIGAASGGLLAAIVGGLTAVGAISTGGVGLLASGPLVAALAAGGAGAASGGIIGGAIGATIPEHKVKFYEDALEKGSVLVGVKFNEKNEAMIRDTLKDGGAYEVAAL